MIFKFKNKTIMTLHYKIVLLSEWHTGSGLDAGPNADLTVLKDENGLPFIPGRTIKGLLRDSLQEIASVSNTVSAQDIEELFGIGDDDARGGKLGKFFFSNAELKNEEKEEIISNELTPYLYRRFSSTRINKNGVAEDKSLRTIEVTIPVTLYGKIVIPDIERFKQLIELAFKWTRYLGLKRNRGLGRCKFSLIKNAES
jgi:CRISPR/Cas system CSM-associated protein Csm3 (group 7 of RAMP superfamily)